MPTRLPHGAFYGHSRAQAEAGGFRLTQHEVGANTVDLHTHETAHFILVQSGRYRSDALGGRESDGGLLLIYNPPGTTHRDHFAAESGRYRGRFFSMAIDAARMRGVCDAVTLVVAPRRIESRHAITLARRLADQCGTWGPTSPLVVEGLGLELMAWAVARDEQEPAAAPPWLRRAREALRDGDPGGISVTQVAAAVGVHPVHLARSFRRHYGCTPGDFLRHARLEVAARLLEDTARPISDVAFVAGFADQSHLTRAFQQAYGTTPGAHRRARRSVRS